MTLPSIRDVDNLKGKRVLVRVDCNVPIQNGVIQDDTRILASLPTIQYLVEQGAKIILLTHIGRPNGKKVRKLRTKYVAQAIARELEMPIRYISSRWFARLRRITHTMLPGSIVMLENVRFFPGEKASESAFTKELATLGDIFVLDGFGVAHRPAASVSGLSRLLPSYAGLLLEKEVATLGSLVTTPKQPFVAIIGGAKAATKLPTIKRLAQVADTVLVGGTIFNTYLAGKGYHLGDSLFEADLADEALAYCKKRNVVTPVDVVVGKKDGSQHRIVSITKKPQEICKKGECILDVGPKTVELFIKHIRTAKTLVWNGALGYFEQQPFDNGTIAIAEEVANRSKLKNVFGVIGGGETIQVMEEMGMKEYMDFVSTGGGAMLTFLSGETLPGIAALEK